MSYAHSNSKVAVCSRQASHYQWEQSEKIVRKISKHNQYILKRVPPSVETTPKLGRFKAKTSRDYICTNLTRLNVEHMYGKTQIRAQKYSYMDLKLMHKLVASSILVLLLMEVAFNTTFI